MDYANFREDQAAFTPVWILCFGALLGLATLLVVWGILWLVRPVAARELGRNVLEGALFPIFVMTVIMAVLSVLGLFVVREPGRMIASLGRYASVQNFQQTFRLADLESPSPDLFAPGSIPADKVVPLSLRRSELSQLTLRAEGGPLFITGKPNAEAMYTFRVQSGEEFHWRRTNEAYNFFPEEEITALYVRGVDAGATELTVQAENRVAFPEMMGAVIIAALVIGVFAVYFGQQLLFPKMSAVAVTTAKNEMAQPVYLLVLIGGMMALILFRYLPYNTFGEDIKMLMIIGLDLIKVLGIFVALWAASNSVAEEIDGRTALTLLSKPVRRHEFILGKMAGITWALVSLFFVLGIWFMAIISFKVVHDAREMSQQLPAWQQCFAVMSHAAPGLYLQFLEATVFVALGVAISTRLPMVANFIICFSIYALGHLTPLLVQSSLGALNYVEFAGRFISTIFPVLEYYDVQAAIARETMVEVSYLAWATLYTLLYSGAAILLALILFEDRDLA